MPVIKEVKKGKNTAKIWTDDIESEAMRQVENVLSLSFLFKHLSIMPDVHKGWGCPVGSVIATEREVMPACVGVDIGCGMCACQLSLDVGSLEGKLSEIRSAIERVIPVGFQGNKVIDNNAKEWPGWNEWRNLNPGIRDLKRKALEQLGSLGGGNHFIEICYDENNQVWIMLHSGSRHIGKALADIHVNIAKKEMQERKINLPDRDLAFLRKGTKEFEDYLHDVTWAQDYARKNREIMMNRILNEIACILNNGKSIPKLLEVNCHHNYVAEEKCEGKKIFVTRKGATRAGKDEYGIIPGSMGVSSFITKGLGNLDSYDSSSHGAGRRMSRHEAKRRFSRNDLERETNGVECRKDKGVLDEIPSAYKNINKVIEDQKDLVTIVAKLKQLICVKG